MTGEMQHGIPRSWSLTGGHFYPAVFRAFAGHGLAMGNSGHRQGTYALPAEQWFPVILIQALFSATLQVASLSQWFPRHLETEHPRDACFFKIGGEVFVITNPRRLDRLLAGRRLLLGAGLGCKCIYLKSYPAEKGFPPSPS
jgi:hypothetical protein